MNSISRTTLPVVAIIAAMFLPLIAKGHSDLALLISAGEYIGGGQTYHTTNRTAISVFGSTSELTVSAFDFLIKMVPRSQSALAVGEYTNTVSYNLAGSSP